MRKLEMGRGFNKDSTMVGMIQAIQANAWVIQHNAWINHSTVAIPEICQADERERGVVARFRFNMQALRLHRCLQRTSIWNMGRSV